MERIAVRPIFTWSRISLCLYEETLAANGLLVLVMSAKEFNPSKPGVSVMSPRLAARFEFTELNAALASLAFIEPGPSLPHDANPTRRIALITYNRDLIFFIDKSVFWLA